MVDPGCKKCDGTGWIYVEKNNIVQTARCECFHSHIKNKLFEQARIPTHYKNCSLDNFQPINSSIAKAQKTASSFVQKYPILKAGLMFMGPCGVGKTHLAVAIIQRLILEKEVACIFYDFRDLIEEIKKTYGKTTSSTAAEVLSPVLKCDVLVLDELGALKMTDWVKDMLMYVVNQRYNENRLTVFTTNYLDSSSSSKRKTKAGPSKNDPDEYASLGERIGMRLRSRLNEMCQLVMVEGDDYRENMQHGYHT